MAVYTTSAEVSALTKIPISSSTEPSSTTVTAWIEEKEAEVHNVLGSLNLTTPVSASTSPNTFNQIKTRVREAVAAQVIDAYHGKKSNEKLQLTQTYEMRYKGFLNEIQRRPEILWDAAQVTSYRENFGSQAIVSTHTVYRAFTRADKY